MHEIIREQNPSNQRWQFAVYVNGCHCGYVESYFAGQALVDQILKARAKVRLPA